MWTQYIINTTTTLHRSTWDKTCNVMAEYFRQAFSSGSMPTSCGTENIPKWQTAWLALQKLMNRVSTSNCLVPWILNYCFKQMCLEICHLSIKIPPRFQELDGGATPWPLPGFSAIGFSQKSKKCPKKIKVARAWRETMPVCSGLTRLVRAGCSRHDSGANRERARIPQRAQDGSVHTQACARWQRPHAAYPPVQLLSRPVDFNKFEMNKQVAVYHSFDGSCYHELPLDLVGLNDCRPLKVVDGLLYKLGVDEVCS